MQVSTCREHAPPPRPPTMLEPEQISSHWGGSTRSALTASTGSSPEVTASTRRTAIPLSANARSRSTSAAGGGTCTSRCSSESRTSRNCLNSRRSDRIRYSATATAAEGSRLESNPATVASTNRAARSRCSRAESLIHGNRTTRPSSRSRSSTSAEYADSFPAIRRSRVSPRPNHRAYAQPGRTPVCSRTDATSRR